MCPWSCTCGDGARNIGNQNIFLEKVKCMVVPLCHFILVCTKLSRIRKRHLQKIEDDLEKIHKGLYIRIVSENALLQVIIDCTSSSINYMRSIRSKNYTELEVLTRNVCSDLHRSRVRQMAG